MLAHKGRNQPQLLPEEGGDLLAVRFSSGMHSSQVDVVGGGILLVLQPEEEAVGTIEAAGHTPKADFKAAQGHPWATARRVMTFHPIDTFFVWVLRRQGGGASFRALTIFSWNFLQLLI